MDLVLNKRDSYGIVKGVEMFAFTPARKLMFFPSFPSLPLTFE